MDAPQPINDARPRKCPCCGKVQEIGGAKLLHGHGPRQRQAVLPDHRVPVERAQLVLVWVRRFLCTACGASVTVLPPGLLPRCVYSLFAIVTAWWLAISSPFGAGLPDDAVCARQGVDRLACGRETHRTGRRRWRSLARWAGRIQQWWPSRATSGTTWRAQVTSLLIGFGTQLGEDGLPVMLARAAASHAGRGVFM